MRRPVLKVLTASLAAAGICLPASAQNISGVSGADVTANAAKFEYRAGYTPETNGDESAFAHRFNLQYGLDARWRIRAMLVQTDTGGAGLKTQDVSLEVMNQILESENAGGWDSAIRVDGRIPVADDRPGRVRVAWINNVDLGAGWAVRANIYTGKEIGDLAKDGITLETREEITYAAGNGIKVGAQLLNKFNTTANFGDFDEQRHQIGPVLKGRLFANIKYETSVLFGLSDAASDVDLRFFVSHGF